MPLKTFTLFDFPFFRHSWWMLFLRRVVRTKFDIYDYILWRIHAKPSAAGWDHNVLVYSTEISFEKARTSSGKLLKFDNEVYVKWLFINTLRYKICQWLATGRWFLTDILVSPTNKTNYSHDIAEIFTVENGVKHHNTNPNPI